MYELTYKWVFRNAFQKWSRDLQNNIKYSQCLLSRIWQSPDIWKASGSYSTISRQLEAFYLLFRHLEVF